MALPKKHRLLIQRQSLSLLRRKGRHVSTPFLSASYRRPGEEEQSRFGLVIGSSISKKAVVRNRVRRYIHDAIYANMGSIPIVDMIIFPKKKIIDLDRDEVLSQIIMLFERIERQ